MFAGWGWNPSRALYLLGKLLTNPAIPQLLMEIPEDPRSPTLHNVASGLPPIPTSANPHSSPPRGLQDIPTIFTDEGRNSEGQGTQLGYFLLGVSWACFPGQLVGSVWLEDATLGRGEKSCHATLSLLRGRQLLPQSGES